MAGGTTINSDDIERAVNSNAPHCFFYHPEAFHDSTHNSTEKRRAQPYSLEKKNNHQINSNLR
jgi:hypothetical protein